MADYTDKQTKAFAKRLRLALEAHGRGANVLVGQATGKLPNNTNRWADGSSVPRSPDVFAIEDALGLEPGELSQHLGYLPVGSQTPTCTIEDALAADERVDAKTAVYIMTVVQRPA